VCVCVYVCSRTSFASLPDTFFFYCLNMRIFNIVLKFKKNLIIAAALSSFFLSSLNENVKSSYTYCENFQNSNLNQSHVEEDGEECSNKEASRWTAS